MAKITVYLSPKKLSPKPRSAACRPALERVRNTLERDIYLAWKDGEVAVVYQAPDDDYGEAVLRVTVMEDECSKELLERRAACYLHYLLSTRPRAW